MTVVPVAAAYAAATAPKQETLQLLSEPKCPRVACSGFASNALHSTTLQQHCWLR